MDSNSPHSSSARSDLPKDEALFVNFRVRIEKGKMGCKACHIEGVEFQPPCYEAQEFFLPFVSEVRNGMDSYLNQFYKTRLTLKIRMQQWIKTRIKKTN
jgi:hypothetical protein